jgi:hypothetical protein
VARRPARAWETVKALAGLDVQVMLVRKLVPATRAMNAHWSRVAQRLAIVLPTGHHPGGRGRGCYKQGRCEAPDLVERIAWVVSHEPNYRRARASQAVLSVLAAGMTTRA